MQTSIVIPVWNGIHFLPACLDALLAQQTGTQTFEIIAVDNASNDGSGDLIAQRYPQVRLLRNRQNQGFAGGCNRGIEAAQGDLIVLLNQDTQVQADWLPILTRVALDPANGVVGCKTLYPDGKTVQHAGGWIDWPLGLSHHRGQGEPDGAAWNQSGPVEFVTGAALAVRRSVLDQIGLLDEAFWPGYFEDADFCLRVQTAGYAVIYCAEAVVLHQESASWTARSGMSAAYQQGRLRFLLKQLPPPQFLAEFVPAERAYQPAAVRGLESAALQTAYLAAQVAAPYLLHTGWQADDQTIQQVIQALRELYQSAWNEEQQKARQVFDNLSLGRVNRGEKAIPVAAAGAAPVLTEFEFESKTPVLGPLLTAMREMWYNMAARWADRHDRQQQEVINQQVATQLQMLRQQIDGLAQQNAALARQLVQLKRELEKKHG